VRYLSQTFAGRIHDKRICDEEDYRFLYRTLLLSYSDINI
jgi:hypothetical protein